MSRHLQAALFDFDGTLARLSIDFKQMRKLALAELAAVLGPDDPAIRRDDLPVMELIHAAGAKRAPAVRAEIIRRAESAVSACELEAAGRSALFHYTVPILKALGDSGVKTAIVTRNCRAAVEKVFPDHASFCPALICREDVPPEALKPNPGQLLAALATLGRAPEESLMIGDHPMDVGAGKAAGCLTAGVLSGNASREEMEKAAPDWLAPDCAALLAELGLFP